MSNLLNLSDYDLVLNIKNNSCSESFNELINRHDQLYYSVVQKFHLKHPESDLQSLLDDLYIVFNETINKYDLNKKTKFSTYLFYMTRFHCLNTTKKNKNEVSFDNGTIDSINEKNNKYVTFSSNIEEINQIIFNTLNKLKDKRISKIFQRRFIDVDNNKLTSWYLISKEVGLSVTGTINLYNKGIVYLNKMLHSKKDKII